MESLMARTLNAASLPDSALAVPRVLANAANIDGTPAFIVNGRVREGAMTDDVLAQMTKAS
jgi:protein-disulfide isomerase